MLNGHYPPTARRCEIGMPTHHMRRMVRLAKIAKTSRMFVASSISHAHLLAVPGEVEVVGVLEADEEAAGDADDEDEAEDDEGGHHDQDHQTVVLLGGTDISDMLTMFDDILNRK